MLILLGIGTLAVMTAEWNGNAVAEKMGFIQSTGNLEGKEEPVIRHPGKWLVCCLHDSNILRCR